VAGGAEVGCTVVAVGAAVVDGAVGNVSTVLMK
jgi:hypothetical protein